MSDRTRRTFLKILAAVTGGAVLAPVMGSCSGAKEPEVPKSVPEGWDPIAFNRERGNAGAIPDSYLGDVNGPDGEKQHLGKHLPYLVEVDPEVLPDGYVAIMWGDAGQGYARHPNAVRGEDNNHEGHWYDWIRVRKAVAGEAEETETIFSDWPETAEDDSGRYAVQGEGELTDDGGKNTIYLVKLPSDVKKGDTVRIWAHCLTHGEYVDFVTL
jgi:hypothetical protein